jgi:hypothetical protein
MNPLQSRLAALRRRLRWIVTVRGGCWALAILLGSLALATQIDRSFYARWQRDLPALVRALFLVCGVGGAGYVAYRFFLKPLRTRTDDLSLALRVEERYPILNDSLASTIQFLAQTEDTPGVSKALQGEAIQRALRLAKGCDFNKAADTRGTRPALLALLVGCVLVLPLILGDRSLAGTSLMRFLDPFGGHRWGGEEPTTHLVVRFPPRLTSDQEFVVEGKVSGVIPAGAEVEYEGLLEGDVSERQPAPIDQGSGEFRAHKSFDVRRPDFRFRFRVRAGKAVSPEDGGWYEVEVQQAVQWAALHGKASPQLELFYPRYTDLPSPERLEEGSGDVIGIREPQVPPGTLVRLRAAVNRPVLRVWVEHLPDDPAERVELRTPEEEGAKAKPAGKPVESLVATASRLSCFGPRHPLEALTLAAGGHAVWGRTYGAVLSGGKEFAIDFMPWTRGRYRVVLEREPGLTQSFVFKEEIVPDEPPTVKVLTPAEDQLVGEGSRIPLRVEVTDERYAVRSVYLEYRHIGKDGRYRDAGPTRVPLYDHRGLGTGLPELLEALTGTAWPAPSLGLKLRPQRLALERSWSLAGLAEVDEVLEVEVCAHDFNDVSAFPVPGRSGKLRLRIVGKEALQKVLTGKRQKIEKALIEVQKKQDQALEMVKEAEKQLREKGKLPLDQLRKLEEAELLQKQILKEIGEEPTDGLRGEVARLRQELKDNNLEHSAADAWLRRTEEELAELSQKSLKELPEQLRAAQDKLGAKQEKQGKPAPKQKSDLEQARAQQQRVAQALRDLLKGREGSADMQALRGEMRRILEEQRALQKETEELEQDVRKNPPAKDEGAEPGGKKSGKGDRAKPAPLRLTHAQNEKRTELASRQEKLGRDLQALLDKMKKITRKDDADREPGALEKLKEALDLARDNGFPEALLDTARQLHDPTEKDRNPNINQAVSDQELHVDVLKRMAKALEEGRDSEIAQLVKRQRGAKKELDQLTEKLEKLRKRIREARKRGDAKELKQAQAELQDLQKEMEKKGRELARLRAERAGEALDEAGAQLERAGKRMADGGDPDEDLKQAQKRMQDAQKKFKEAQERAEEELAREQLARLADQIKGLKVRQDAAIAESLRLHKTLLEKGAWTTERLRSLDHLADSQQGLAKETGSLKEKLKGAAVFELLLKTTAETMGRAGTRLQDRTKTAVARPDPAGALLKEELAAEQKAHDQTVRLQREASRRLQRLIDALKPDPNVAMRPKQKAEGKEGEPKKGEKAKGGIPGESIPPLAQLKALRAEQQEVNDRTREFAKRHPDEAKLGPEERAELEAIRSNQQELHELFSKLAASVGGAPAGGGNP